MEAKTDEKPETKIKKSGDNDKSDKSAEIIDPFAEKKAPKKVKKLKTETKRKTGKRSGALTKIVWVDSNVIKMIIIVFVLCTVSMIVGALMDGSDTNVYKAEIHISEKYVITIEAYSAKELQELMDKVRKDYKD
jgi:serine/threonine-protein kinase RIO1